MNHTPASHPSGRRTWARPCSCAVYTESGCFWTYQLRHSYISSTCKRIWVTDHAETPVPRPRCLLQAEERHRWQGRVRLLLLLLRHAVWVTDGRCDSDGQRGSSFHLQLQFMFLNLRTPFTSLFSLIAAPSPIPSTSSVNLLFFLLHTVIVAPTGVNNTTRNVLPVGRRNGKPHLLVNLLLLPFVALWVLKAHSPLAISHDRASGRATLKGGGQQRQVREWAGHSGVRWK